jgi:hypothetical protein
MRLSREKVDMMAVRYTSCLNLKNLIRMHEAKLFIGNMILPLPKSVTGFEASL